MSEKISDELVERMVKLVRDIAEDSSSQVVVEHQDAARAISELLPKPVDPDSAEARELVAEKFPDAAPADQWVLEQVTYLGIKRGRELERAKLDEDTAHIGVPVI